ncbi:MAG: sugar nucleotide-binding protein [Sedimentisphaerales bacterium]|nr:sugar nucleotide-binding protein [Sedimentisphaerales bacterium]
MVNTQQKILVTGITSIHGWPIWRLLSEKVAAGRLFGICPPATRGLKSDNVLPACITDRSVLQRVRDEFSPDIIVHCAGVCDLDVCEERPAWAHNLNVRGLEVLSEVFGDSARMIFMSTDLVFSGKTPPVGGYTEKCPTDPVSVVGKTFALAESFVSSMPGSCIIRLGLPLGDSYTGDKGAIDWVGSRLSKGRPVTLFYDELRSCIWCDQIAQMALSVIKLNLIGLYNFGGNTSWSLHDIGLHVVDKVKCQPELLKGIMRCEEVNGPPRAGDISINSNKIKSCFDAAGVVIAGFNDIVQA